MPRVWLKADEYAKKDFWKAIKKRCIDLDITTQQGFSQAIGICDRTARKYQANPQIMQVETMQKIVEVIRPNPRDILVYLGYSTEEIKQFARECVMK